MDQNRLTKLQARLGVSTGLVRVEDPFGVGLVLNCLPLNSPQYQRFVQTASGSILSMRIMQSVQQKLKLDALTMGPGSDESSGPPEVPDINALVIAEFEGYSTDQKAEAAEKEAELELQSLCLLVQSWEGHTYEDGEEVKCTDEEKRNLFTDATKIPSGTHGAGRTVGSVLSKHVLQQLQITEMHRALERATVAKNSESSSGSDSPAPAS